MDPLVQLLTALAEASQLFLVAAGLTVIFGVTRVVNFSHGSLCMLGAYIGWSILTRLPLTPIGLTPCTLAAGILAAAAATATIGLLIETTLLRRIYRAPELFQLLATFGVVLILQDVTLHLWGPNDLTLPRPRWLRATVEIGTARFPVFELALIAIGPAILGLLALLFTRTRWGTLVRAATLDRDMVAALGVDQRWLFTSVFALGAALAALLIALLQSFGLAILPEATLVLPFAVMAVILVLRPNGLLGRPQSATRTTPDALPVIHPAAPILKALAAAALILALAAPLVLGPYGIGVLTEATILVLFAASLHFIMGPGGLVSFGHAAWFGIGAYTAALLVRHAAIPMPLGIAAAPVAAALAALAFGALVVRLSGVYLAMLTLAFAQIVWAAAFQATALTGGDNGILGVWPADWARDPAAFYYLTLALCLGTTLLLRRILYAPFGYALRATRDSPLRAEAIGLPTRAIRLAAFTVAGAAAGLAGAVYAYSKGSVFPTYVSIPKSVDALLMVLLGGVGTIAGPIVGALAYVGLYDALLRATDLWRLVLGAAIILLVVAFPEGIAGASQRAWARVRP